MQKMWLATCLNTVHGMLSIREKTDCQIPNFFAPNDPKETDY